MTERGLVDNLSSALLALVLATMVWLNSNAQNRPIQQISSYPTADAAGIPIEFVAPAGMAVFGPSSRTARLQLRGIQVREAMPLGADAFSIVADLRKADLEADRVTTRLDVRCAACARRGVRVVGIDPPVVAVSVGQEISETRSVVVEADSPPPGYRVVEQTSDPPQVTLRGARSRLAEVDRVVARVRGVENLRRTRTFGSVDLVPVDEADDALGDVRVEPAVAAIRIGVRLRGIEISVRPVITGEVRPGYFVEEIAVDPKAVLTSGDPSVVDVVGSISTQVIDLGRFTEDEVLEVPLVVPEGLSIIEGPDAVTVTVRIGSLTGSRSVEVPIEARGLRVGLGAALSPDQVYVLVKGPQPLLNELDQGVVSAYVDVAGLGPGTHRLRPLVDVPDGLGADSTIPEEVEVTIRSTASPAAGAATPTPRR